MRRIFSLILFLLLNGSVGFAAGEEERRLLLVTGAASGITSLSNGEIRRLFLGLPVEKDGHLLEAAINRSDPFLYEVFLQKIVGMSSIIYDRHLLANVIQIGGQRPKVFNDTRTLIGALTQNHGTVTVLWDNEATAPNLSIIGEVWRGAEK